MYYTSTYWTTEVWENGPDTDDMPLYIFQKGPDSALVLVYDPESMSEIDRFTMDDLKEAGTYSGFITACLNWTEDARKELNECCMCGDDEESPFICSACMEKQEQ
ncbi:hypothetical protein D1872_81620 [compost metagenome]